MIAPRINAIVDLLTRHSSARLASLRERYPEMSDELRVGAILGDELCGPLKAYVETAREGLRTALESVPPDAARIRSRLGMVKRLRLWGSMLGGMSVIALLERLLSRSIAFEPIALITAVAFVASLCDLLAHHNETPLYGGGEALFVVFEKLLVTEARARSVITEMEIAQITESDPECLINLVREANKLASDLNAIEQQLW